MGQKVCSPVCAIEYGRKKQAVERKSATRKAKVALNRSDRSYMLKKAQAAFNAYIRERGKDLPCISCGRHHAWQYHAGHYRPAGNNSGLRFEELNCHKQCQPCNSHKSGNLTNYRIGLIAKIGIELVEWLECCPEPKRWTCEELADIAKTYRGKLRALK